MQTPAHALVNRAAPNAVALETTLLVHGVPRDRSAGLAHDLAADVTQGGGTPAVVGICEGRPTVGLTDDELRAILDAPHVEKANTTNMGVLMHRGMHGATTVSATLELSASAGVRVFATGGLGGVHRGYGAHWDVSADLLALRDHPVAVVASGVKSLLDVESTREFLETIGVAVVGFGCDKFPAFYRRASGAGVDARFDDADELGAYLSMELARRGRGVVVANPIPVEAEIAEADLRGWLDDAAQHAGNATGRDVTPRVLAHLHTCSGGATLDANIALVRGNASLAGKLAKAMSVIS